MLCFIIFSIFHFSFVGANQPNPPKWPSSVYIDPSQGQIDAIFSRLGGNPSLNGKPNFNGQFSTERVALLFTSGYKNVDVNVGYYTSVIGLGEGRSTELKSLQCHNSGDSLKNGALNSFWRSAENLKLSTNDKVLWATSQAASLRNVEINGGLLLCEYAPKDNPQYLCGYASGGFMADVKVSGDVLSGSQQQWLSRNSEFGKWPGGVWNMVFLGCPNAPATDCKKYTTVDTTPIIAEKPYLIETGGKYYLKVPSVVKNSRGVANHDSDVQIAFEYVFVATSDTSAEDLDAALANSHIRAIVFSPGIYKLVKPIEISRDIVVYGMGFPTLISPQGGACFKVTASSGVRISGFLLQAGVFTGATEPLLMWGLPGKVSGSESNPGFLYDTFARIGGDTSSQTSNCQRDVVIQINSDHVVIDNAWYWRADHDIGGPVKNRDNPTQIGLEVNGRSVRAYGLMSEHHLEANVQWNGEDGIVVMFQSELPYDPTQDQADAVNLVSYRINSTIQNHQGYGIGAYSFFRDYPVRIPNAFAFGGNAPHPTPPPGPHPNRTTTPPPSPQNTCPSSVCSWEQCGATVPWLCYEGPAMKGCGASEDAWKNPAACTKYCNVDTCKTFAYDEGGIKIVNALTVFLDGQGAIEHVIDGKGPSADASDKGSAQYVCNYP